MDGLDGIFAFMVFYDILFPDDGDKEVECPHCGRVVKGSESVGWVAKGEKFKCPDCGEEIEL